MLASSVTVESFGHLPDGREVKIFTLTNSQGLRARITDYGAILVSMVAPDRHGHLADLTHGFDTLAGWLANGPYFGATIGRFGNRIRNGKFTLDGKTYTLANNNSPGGIPCHLHGGQVGFDKVLWHGQAKGDDAVELSYLSNDGEEGYPGNLSVKVTYTLTDDNELIWQAEASTDAPTIVNLVHHSYWNLSGDPTTSILSQHLTLDAGHYLPTDAGLIPTGVLAPVAGTPMDFTTPVAIGARIEADFEALKLGAGYDHCWVLNEGSGVRLAARLKDPHSGRVMEIFTDQPAIQVYAANFLDGLTPGKGGVPYARRSALCLETEGFPDSPNQPAFPSPVLRPGQIYHHTLVHKFSAE
jgi:aldose 1-epimerase